jgi:hypothetical protein
MIVRVWKGVVRTADAEVYASIKAFAGQDIEVAVPYPEDERYLVGESTIVHYEVEDTINT